MTTRADTDRRVALSPLQSASDHALPVRHSASGTSTLLSASQRSIFRFTRSISRADGFAMAQHTCIDATLGAGRSCDCTACHHLLWHVPVTVTHAVPLVLSLSLSLSASVLSLAFVTSCVALTLPFHGAWRRRVIRSFQLKILQHLPAVSLIRLDCDAVTTPFNEPIQYSSTLLKVCVLSRSLVS